MTIQITSIEELFKIGVDASFPIDGDYELAQDLDATGETSLIPIGYSAGAFTGSFDGKGHTLSNLSIVHDASVNGHNAGLFAVLGDGSEVKNLTFKNCMVLNEDSDGDTTGILAGKATLLDATTTPIQISNITITGGNVTGYSKVGGLIGEVLVSDVQTLYTPLIQVEKIYVKATLTSVHLYARFIGGIFGYASRLEMSQSYFEGTLKPKTWSINGMPGGLISEADNMIKLEDCYAKTNIDYLDEYNIRMGGLISGIFSKEHTTINRCYAVTNIPNVDNKNNHQGGLVQNFYNVTNPSLYIDDNHWDIDVSGMAFDALGVEGEATSRMQTQATYSSWNFNSLWYIETWVSYPSFERSSSSNDGTQDTYLMLEYRNNNEGRWSAPRMISLGKTGETSLIQVLRKLGCYSTRQYRLTWSSRVPIVLATFDEEVKLP